MSRLTLAIAQQLLAKYVSPQETFIENINLASSRLLQSGKWKGSRFTCWLRSYDGQVTTPPFVESLDRFIHYGDEEHVIDIKSEWFQFSEEGYGWFDTPNSPYNHLQNHVATRLGDGYCTFRDPHPPSQIQVVLEAPETGSLLIKAYDQDSSPIFSGSPPIEGISIDLSSLPIPSTAQTISQIYQIVKPTTTGRVKLYSYPDGNYLAEYSPAEQNPNYQRYRIAHSNPKTQSKVLYALATRSFIPALFPNDQIFPSNLPALRYALQALRFEEVQDPLRAHMAWQDALASLEEELATLNLMQPNGRFKSSVKAFLSQLEI